MPVAKRNVIAGGIGEGDGGETVPGLRGERGRRRRRVGARQGRGEVRYPWTTKRAEGKTPQPSISSVPRLDRRVRRGGRALPAPPPGLTFADAYVSRSRGRPVKVGFITLGCDKNSVDSERYL